jgi:hypothetical protein
MSVKERICIIYSLSLPPLSSFHSLSFSHPSIRIFIFSLTSFKFILKEFNSFSFSIKLLSNCSHTERSFRSLSALFLKRNCESFKWNKEKNIPSFSYQSISLFPRMKTHKTARPFAHPTQSTSVTSHIQRIPFSLPTFQCLSHSLSFPTLIALSHSPLSILPIWIQLLFDFAFRFL